ncbi:MAG TPA: transglutaminase family protein [Tepidisphaeraceae bacterium]|jgi:transglutaminase-like putative cysteine protease|nr:transglutaminase family protein [Tepidisphaeraceae bacterium]
MLLKITHKTDLTYNDLISESVMELRMSPRQENDQHRLSFALSVGPATAVASYFDWLGNTVHALTINAHHDAVRVIATSVVETDRPVPLVGQKSDLWPVPLQQIDYAMYDYLQLAGPVVDCAPLRELAASVNPRDGEPLGAVAARLLTLVGTRFNYQKGVTTAASPITEILQHGRGVCQDFSHLMIGLARVLHIPARYVSGFIHRDGERYRGYAQTHAWCELYFPSTGWIGFDPTNGCLVGSNFIKIGHGRDFRDVSPNKGVFRGTADEKIEVTVEMEELPCIPPSLVGERFQTIDLVTARHRPDTEHVEAAVTQQQEQQQQELRQQQEQQQQQ